MSSKTCQGGERRLVSGVGKQGGEEGGAYHGGHAPYVSACSPLGAEDYLWRAVLACLDVVGKVVVYPAGIPEIGNLDADDVAGLHVVGLALLACRREGRGGLVQRDARHFPRQEIRRLFPLFLVLLGVVRPRFR